jgi:predicted nucleic acid-binding protein
MIVICDTSPLIALSIVDKLELLEALFEEVVIPVSVFNELNKTDKPESQRIAVWAQGKVAAAMNKQLLQSFSLLLDMGESEAMTLYFEKEADFLLIDEKKGRKIATYNKINIVGSLGILLLSKQKGLIPLIKPFLNRLQQSYIRISDELYLKALELADEK